MHTARLTATAPPMAHRIGTAASTATAASMATPASMARVLKSIPAETTIVIAHGLASEQLYGDFDAVDVVEKEGDVSMVRVSV